MRESLSWQFPFRFPWDMRRSQGFRQFTDCMVRCSRSFYSDYFPRHHSLFLVWMQPGCAGRICHRRTWNRKWHKRSHGGSSGADFFVALWLLAFYFMKAGKLVNFISAPVMGGFITGICTTIILMQVPKLMGGTAGVGELF